MLRNKIKKWVSLKFTVIILSLSSLLVIFIAPSVSALSLNSTTVATTAPSISCSIDFLSPLSYFECPIIDGLNGFINYLDAVIDSQLTINGCSYLNATNGVNNAASCSKLGEQPNS
ncbi:MAG TPA: hypothetical protein VII94_01360, partial [Candidatus Saccharimonadales bacterium]